MRREDEDPCEVYLSDYQAVDGRQLPHRIEVRYGDKHLRRRSPSSVDKLARGK